MKKLDAESLKRSVTLYIAIAMLVLTIITVFVTAYTQNYRASIEEKKYNKQVDLGIEHVVKHYIHDYSNWVNRLLKNTNVAELIKNRDRDALYNLFKPKWDIMVEGEENLNIMHFHLSDGSSFLRVHKPEQHGDNLLSIRPMLKEVHIEHKRIDGYETGKYATSYRIISPIFDKNGEYIGAFELGLNPKFILRAVHDINNFSGMMFIKDDVLDLHSAPSKIVIDGYRLQSKLSPELKKISAVLEVANKLENGMEVVVDAKSYKTHLFTLDSFENESRVKIIFFQNTTRFGIFRTYVLNGFFVSLFLIISGLIWLIYRRIGLYQNDVTASYKNQIKLLNESEHRFERLYQTAPEAYQSLDIDGNITIVNLKWLEDLGYSKDEEVLGKNFGDFLAPGFREKFKENFPKFKEAGGITDIEFDMVRKDGEIITVSFNGKIVRDEENIFQQTHCIFTNVTEQKHARETLEESERFLKAIFDINPNIMIVSNGEIIETVNPAMLSFFTYDSLEEFSRKHDCICDFFLKGDACLESKVDGMNWLEYILKHRDRLHRVCMLKDSKKHYFTIKAHTVGIDESKRSIVFFNDVTEIEEIGRRLEYAVEGANDGLWDWNLEENSVYFSPRLKEMIGYKDVELMNVFETWQSRIHPDDLDKVLENIQKSHSSPEVEYQNTYRLRHKDGHWVWILSRGQTIFDNSAKAIRMVGFNIDISELKELEMQLRENEQVYYDFFEHSKSANIMYETDDDGKTFKIKNLNSFLEHLENVKKKDLIGKRVDEVFPGVEEFGLLDIFRDVYKSGKAHKMPLSLYEDDTKSAWRENYIFRLSNGNIVASYEDRTKEKELEALLSNTINSVENMIFVKDSNFRYLECNRAFEKFIGISREELIGKEDYDLFDNKEVADAFRSYDEEMLKSGATKSNYEWVTYPDGSEVYLLTVKAPLRDVNDRIIGLVGNSVDLTKEKQLEDELRSSKQEFEKFMENVPGSILIKDENLRILYANKMAKSFFNSKDIVGLKSEDLLSAEDIETANRVDARILENNFIDEIDEYTNYAKEKRIYRTMGFVIGDEGPTKIGTIIVDITDEYAMRDELHDKEELMIAQSRHAAMGEMISMIAHQWRQPISVIAMDANNILADIELGMVEESTLKVSSLDIVKQTQELSKTIDDFRNFFRPQKEVDEVRLKELFDDALTVIGKSLENSQVEISLEVDENKKIRTFSRELMQVFINIIKNAKEALVDKGVKDKKISIFTREDKECITLKICDNAGGVKVEDMENIFDPYFTTKGKKNGTGLGLYMSKTIVEKHLQGSLSVSNEDAGACFEITLPFSILEKDDLK